MAWLSGDIKSAWRNARQRPGFAMAILLTLGVGIGATSAAFSVMDAVVLQPLPYQNADRVLGVWFSSPNFPGGLSRVRMSMATFLHWRDQSSAFEQFAVTQTTSVTVDDGTAVSRVVAGAVSADIFAVLGITPEAGRAFTLADNAPGAAPTVMLAESYWAAGFGRDPGVIGTAVVIDGETRRIVGVIPDEVRFPSDQVKLWLPLEIDASAAARTDFVYTAYGLLKPGVTVSAAAQDFDRLVNTLPEAWPSVFPRPLLERLQLSSLFVPLQDELVGDSRQAIVIVFMSTLVILLIVLANITNLLVVRGESRQRELAVRSAIGASPAHLRRALLVESSGYGIIGGLLGLCLGLGALALVKQLGFGTIPRLHEVGIDLRIAAVVIGVSILVGMVVGLVPAWRLGKTDLTTVLRSDSKSVVGQGSLSIRWALVTGQVALAMALLVNAGLLARSAAKLQSVDPGFRASGVIGARLFLPERDYPDYRSVERFYLDLVDRTRQLNGVDHAAAATFLPLRDGRIFYAYNFPDAADGQELPGPRLTKVVVDGYFQTMGIPLIEGRTINRDDIEVVTDVVVVNQAFARLQWPGGTAVGQRLRYGGGDGSEDGAWFEVIGVVGDVRDRDLALPGQPMVYFPMQERHAKDRRWREMSLAVRSSTPKAVSAALERLVADQDRHLPVADLRSMSEVKREATARLRYTTLLLVLSAASALFLAAVGLYGVLAFIVNDRRREMGLRMALGAEPRQVRRLVMRQALALVGSGAGLGILVTVATNRFLGTMLYGVGTLDVPTFLGVIATLAAVSWLAASIPSNRAAAVAPAITLKGD